MCGIVGIFSHKPVAYEIYESLIHLQHRGQDAAGILTCDHQFYSKQGSGLVRDTFTTKNVLSLKGNMGIGHTRYPTAGGYSASDVQPLWVENPLKIGLAHNGNLINYEKLVATIADPQALTLQSSLDSEVLLLMLAKQLGFETDNMSDERFFELLCLAMQTIFERAEGAYSVVTIIPNRGMIAFRDPHGIRPLVWGSRKNPEGSIDTIFASETTPFYALGFNPEGDVLPGEVVFINQEGKKFQRIIKTAEFRPCVFEYVYFARPDATLNSVSVYRSRLRMGQNLALQWQKKYPDIRPDIVIPAPFTANTAALSFAHAVGVRYSEGLYKNPFIGRTFIMPDQSTRTSSIRHKLTPQRTEINNKNVLIVDDSIVRGTTSREIVKMVRESGAKNIYFVSTSPPLINPCFYGIDIPSSKELIAAQVDEQSVAQFIGVDILLYQTLPDLVEAVTRRGDHHIKKPCMACMDGDYFCKSINRVKMQELELEREAARNLKPDDARENLVK